MLKKLGRYFSFRHVFLAWLPHGRVFAFIFNARALVLGVPVKVAWVGTGYTITDRDLRQQRFFAKAQRYFLWTYRRGFRRKVEQIIQRRLLKHIKFAKGDVVLDCGAQLGDLKLAFDLMGVKVRYIGFEPDPVVFESLKHTIAYGGRERARKGAGVAVAEVHNVGLWHEKGELPFYVSSYGADSSFIEPARYTEIIRIPTLPIRQFIKHKQKIKLLKLEAEGAELEVLQGAGSGALKNSVEYISADLGAERGPSEDYTFVPVTNFLFKHGFEAVALWSDGHYLNVLFRNTRFN